MCRLVGVHRLCDFWYTTTNAELLLFAELERPTMRNGKFPGEKQDIRKEIEALVKEPSRWMDAPNDQLGGEKPRDLIGTDREQRLRDLLRAIRYGIPT
jgi:hypothetical protein